MSLFLPFLYDLNFFIREIKILSPLSRPWGNTMIMKITTVKVLYEPKSHINDLIMKSAILQMLLKGDYTSKKLYGLSMLIYAKKNNQGQSHC